MKTNKIMKIFLSVTLIITLLMPGLSISSFENNDDIKKDVVDYSVPSDIVFVVDTGVSTDNRDNGFNKEVVLKLQKMIEKVKKSAVGEDGKFDTKDDINHRVAVVSYSNEEESFLYLQDNKLLYSNVSNSDYKLAFHDLSTNAGSLAIDNITSNIKVSKDLASNPKIGLELAEGILNNNEKTLLDEPFRNRVVIHLSDGIIINSDEVLKKDEVDENQIVQESEDLEVIFEEQIEETNENIIETNPIDEVDENQIVQESEDLEVIFEEQIEETNENIIETNPIDEGVENIQGFDKELYINETKNKANKLKTHKDLDIYSIIYLSKNSENYPEAFDFMNELSSNDNIDSKQYIYHINDDLSFLDDILNDKKQIEVDSAEDNLAMAETVTNNKEQSEIILNLTKYDFTFDKDTIRNKKIQEFTSTAGYEDVRDVYGYFAFYDGGDWVRIVGSEISGKNPNRIEYSFANTYLNISNILDKKHTFIIESAEIDKNKVEFNDITAKSEDFYLADLFKEGFREFAKNVYPTVHNNGNKITTVANLAEAFNVFQNYSLDVSIKASSEKYQVKEDVLLDILITSPNEDMKKNDILTIELTDEDGNKLPSSTDVLIKTQGVDLVSVDGNKVTLKVTSDMIKDVAKVGFTYAYNLPNNAPLGKHIVKSNVTFKSKVYGIGKTSFQVEEARLLISKIEGGDKTYYPGDKIEYNIHITNFGNTTLNLSSLLAVVEGLTLFEKQNMKHQISVGESIIIPITFNTPIFRGGSKLVEFTIKDGNNASSNYFKNLKIQETNVLLTPSITNENNVINVKLSTSKFNKAKYEQVWQYRDDNGEWTTLHQVPAGADIETSTYTLSQSQLNDLRGLNDSSLRQYRLKLNLGTSSLFSDSVSFNNIEDLIKMASIQSQIPGLDLKFETLSTYYYDEVAKDFNVPFSDAASFTKILLEAYDKGGIEELSRVYNKYKYDIMDPNINGSRRTGNSGSGVGNGYPVESDHADRNFFWYKDVGKSFHNEVKSQIDKVDSIMKDGYLISNSYFRDLEKSAKAHLPGDENLDRKYTIDIKANVKGAQKPTVMVFQIQTSWQMFDLAHANGTDGNKGDPLVDITDMATLYEIKHALIDFANYLKENDDGTVVFGLTEVKHGGSTTAIDAPYLTNNMDNFIKALEGWDIFGNCEHVHYDKNMLENALAAITSTNLDGWRDKNDVPVFGDAERVAVVIGGTTENDAGTNGYSAVIPKVDTVDTYYTIETITGSLRGSRPRLSWLDTPENISLVNTTGGKQFKNVTSRDKLLATFKDILQSSEGVASNAKDIVLTDIIQPEFKYIENSAKIVSFDIDGNETIKNADNDKLVIEELPDGSQKISYDFGYIPNDKKVHLKFDVQAKEDYIGGNNVLTNVKTPNITYKTDEKKVVRQEFTDMPMVNVPIRFPITDGSNSIVKIGEEVSFETESDLKAKDIVNGIEDYLKKYNQISGTVTYQWQQLDETGNVVITFEALSSEINNGLGSSPSYDLKFVPQEIKDYPFRLNVTFTPRDAERDSGAAVLELTKSGSVIVKARENVLEEFGVIVADKTATKNSDETYNIKLEAYSTGLKVAGGLDYNKDNYIIADKKLVLKDEVTQYFDIIEETLVIETYQYIGGDESLESSWQPNNDGNRATGINNASIIDNKVTVTGFDFGENYVGKTEDSPRGSKLLVSFDIKPKPDFIGGNQVPTNTKAEIYQDIGKAEPLYKFIVPTVDVPIKDFMVTAVDKNIYLMESLSGINLKEASTIIFDKGKDSEFTLDLKSTTNNFGLHKWQNEFIDIEIEVIDNDNNIVYRLNKNNTESPNSFIENLVDNQNYTLKVIISPKHPSTDPEVVINPTHGKLKEGSGTLSVFKPVIKYKDGIVYYGEDLSAIGDLASYQKGVVWKNTKGDLDTEVNMTGIKPDLNFEYEFKNDTDFLDDTVNTKKDIYVVVTINIGTTKINDHVTFKHQCDNDNNCNFDQSKGHFVIHVKTVTLNITKKGGVEGEPYVFTIKKDGVNYTEATITGNNTITISELPVGNYLVKEDVKWSWRFLSSTSGSVVLNKQNLSGEITCTNTANEKTSWLNSYSQVIKNIFGITNN